MVYGGIFVSEISIIPQMTQKALNILTSAFSLTAGAFVLIGGRIGDMFGHKPVYLFGWFWMALWTLLCGFSHSVVMFNICRALAGIGAAVLGPSSMALLGLTYGPSPRKNIAFAILGFLAPCGYIFGGLVGAFFAHFASWRWIFFVWAIMCVAVGSSVWFVVPAQTGRGNPVDRDFDWGGAILGPVALILISFAVK